MSGMCLGDGFFGGRFGGGIRHDRGTIRHRNWTKKVRENVACTSVMRLADVGNAWGSSSENRQPRFFDLGHEWTHVHRGQCGLTPNRREVDAVMVMSIKRNFRPSMLPMSIRRMDYDAHLICPSVLGTFIIVLELA